MTASVFSAKFIKNFKTGKRHKELDEIAGTFETDKKWEESFTSIVHKIMVPSLDSDSHFRRSPLVDLQMAEDLGTSSTEKTYT